jgi:hypothetical protein
MASRKRNTVSRLRKIASQKRNTVSRPRDNEERPGTRRAGRSRLLARSPGHH